MRWTACLALVAMIMTGTHPTLCERCSHQEPSSHGRRSRLGRRSGYPTTVRATRLSARRSRYPDGRRAIAPGAATGRALELPIWVEWAWSCAARRLKKRRSAAARTIDRVVTRLPQGLLLRWREDVEIRIDAYSLGADVEQPATDENAEAISRDPSTCSRRPAVGRLH